MNLLIATNSLCFGGAESFSLQFYEQLLNEGESVKYCTFSSDKSLLKRFPKIKDQEIFNFLDTKEVDFFKIISSFFKVIKFVKKNKIDLVYCCQPQSALIFWLIRLFLKKIKIVYITMHVYDIADKKERLLWKTKLPAINTKYFIGLSQYLANELLSKNKVPKNKIIVNRLPVDIDKFIPLPKQNRSLFNIPIDKKIVGISCRLYSVKRVELFVKAFEFIKNENVKGIIYGDGPDKDMLLEIIKDKNLHDKVEIRDFSDNIHQIIPMFDLYLQTTSGPNLGLATLEAFSCGVPVVMLAENETEEFMVNDTFCFQEIGKISYPDPLKIAQTVDLIFEDLDCLQKMSSKAREVALKEYSWRNFMETNKDLLNKMNN